MSITKGLIIQYGLIGDCLLTLPLASYFRDTTPIEEFELIAFPKYSSYLERRSIFQTCHNMNLLDLQRLHDKNYVPPHELTSTFGLLLKEFKWVFPFVQEKWSVYTDHLRTLCQLAGVENFFPLSFVPNDSWKGHVIEWHLNQFWSMSNAELHDTQDLYLDTTIKPLTRDLEWGRAYLVPFELDGNAPLVAIHPGSGIRWKNIHIDNFLEIGSRCNELDFEVLYFIGPAEKAWMDQDTLTKLANFGHLCYTESFETLIGILSNVSMVICNDSAFSHLSAGLGTHTLTLFGPTLVEWYRPVGPNVNTIQCLPRALKGHDEELICQTMRYLSKLKH